MLTFLGTARLPAGTASAPGMKTIASATESDRAANVRSRRISAPSSLDRADMLQAPSFFRFVRRDERVMSRCRPRLLGSGGTLERSESHPSTADVGSRPAPAAL